MRQFESKRVRILMTSVIAALLCMMLALTAFAAQEKYQLGETEKAWWENETTARWRKVDKAKKYQVRLYQDGTSIVRLTVDTTKVDFAKYIEDDSEYYFEVCAYAKDSTQKTGEWVESDSQYVTGRGDTTGRWRTYQQGKKYQMLDNSYVTNQWYLIAGEWYYFNADGYAKTGWADINGAWYYLNADGKMLTSWQQLDGVWYFMRSDGSMATGWVEAKPGEWYYLYTDGKMAANTVIDGCQLNESGLYVQ